MRCVAQPARSLPTWSRLAVSAAIAVAAVSCSSDSARFANSDPFSSRSSPGPNEVTGSVPQQKMPTASIHSSPLPAPSASAPQTRPAAAAPGGMPVAGGSPGMGSYEPPREVARAVPQQPAPPKVAQPAAAQPAGWTWEGGTPVTAKAGDTAHTLSNRYGVPAAAIVHANNLSSPTAIKPGQRLVIPRYEAQLTTASVNAPRAPAKTSAGRQPLVHTIAPGETLMKLSRLYKKSLSEIAKANNIPPHTQVKIGDRITIPGVLAPAQTVAAASAKPAAQPVKPAQPLQPAAVAQPPKPAAAPPKVVASAPATTAARTITPAADNPAPEAKVVTTSSATPSFRWPVRGRVITAFGPKPTGQQNDGINVAVPEGTPIKAAEDGVIAYAGNELKSYGNLVLIRHSNGYVTAYAHASEILVKRDEPVKRGQVIGKAGQTGNVTAPQLHFEVRKGSSPVDPMPYLEKAGNS